MAREGSPAVRWVIEQLGLGPGLIARTLFAGTLVYVLHRVPDDHAVKSFGTGAALLLNLAVVVNNMLVIIK